MKYIKGAVSLTVVAGTVGSLIMIATPIFMFTDLKETVAVQDVKIEKLENTQVEIRQDLKEINNKMDALLLKGGITKDAINKLNSNE